MFKSKWLVRRARVWEVYEQCTEAGVYITRVYARKLGEVEARTEQEALVRFFGRAPLNAYAVGKISDR